MDRVKIFKIYFLSNFHIYNTILFTIITTYIRYPEHIHLVSRNVYPLTKITLFLAPLWLLSTFYFPRLQVWLKTPHISKIVQYLSFSFSDVFHVAWYPQIHLCCQNGRISFFPLTTCAMSSSSIHMDPFHVSIILISILSLQQE